MPEISSLPALPAAVGAPAAVAGVAPAAPVEADAGGLSFLTQLKTALAGLASAALPQIVATPASATAAPVVPAAAPTPAEMSDDASSDKTTDIMPDMLVALGFLPVPSVLQPQPQVASGSEALGTASVSSQVTTPLAAQSATRPTPRTEAPAPAAPEHAPAAQTHTATVEALTKDATPVEAAPSQLKAAAEHIVAQHDFRQAAQAEQPAMRHATPPSETASVSVATATPHASTPHFGGHGASRDEGETHGELPVEQIGPATAVSNASPEPQIEAAAAGITTTAPIANAALPPHVRASEVVNQIAHQADLYRLPGNKGVRIQLHPEDLGGLDVTLRYSAAGGIQLHINVEHASTGALVQAGWTELRDALAAQGITPDRLVMSVSAPSEASGMDFSSNNSGSYRSENGHMGFDQGRQGQREDAEPQRISRAWFGDTASAETEDSTRELTSAARIDYRV